VRQSGRAGADRVRRIGGRRERDGTRQRYRPDRMEAEAQDAMGAAVMRMTGRRMLCWRVTAMMRMDRRLRASSHRRLVVRGDARRGDQQRQNRLEDYPAKTKPDGKARAAPGRWPPHLARAPDIDRRGRITIAAS